MSKKEMLGKLKQKNVGLEEKFNQAFQERVKKINKHLSRYLYSLLGISITGSLLATAVFFTPWLPGIATALTAAFTAIISALALPLLITIPIITVALVLSPIAASLWKKHQVNSELSNSFEKLKKSLDSLEELKRNEVEDEKTEIKLRQALCIHEFLATEKVAANYDKIDELLENCGISAEWIYVVDLVLKDHEIPDKQEDLDDEIRKRGGDQCDGSCVTINQVVGLDKFLLKKTLRISIFKDIFIIDTSKKEENLNQDNVDGVKQIIRYGLLHNCSTVENSEETPKQRLTSTN
ncbi:MAG: hypothetical protein WAL30_00770 [Candidatus Aquirickettsiella sp.]